MLLLLLVYVLWLRFLSAPRLTIDKRQAAKFSELSSNCNGNDTDTETKTDKGI